MKRYCLFNPVSFVWLILPLFLVSLSLKAQNFDPNIYYRLTAKHNGKVLQVDPGRNQGMDNQANVNVGDWTGGNNQQWKIESQGNGVFRFIARHSGKVLDVNMDVNRGQENQANVVQHEWHGGDNQRWRPEPLGNGYYKMVAVHSGKVLDVNMDVGNNVVQHEWHTGDNQWWKIEPVNSTSNTDINPNTWYRLVAKHNGKVLDVENRSSDNQARIKVADWNGGSNQQWKIEQQGNGFYRIIVRHSGKVLDVNMDVNRGQDNQARVVQHEWHGGDNQRWKIEPVGDGNYRLVAKHSGKMLDVNMDANMYVVQHEWHGGDNQRWKFEPVTGTGTGDGSGNTDLTGFWSDDNGGKYRIRQLGNQVWWVMDQLPGVINVFKGNISGSTISGQWSDLPGGQIQNSGTLELRIVSGNRLEKVSSSANYGGSVWTR